MQSPIIDLLVKVAEQLSMDEQKELLNRLEGLMAPLQRPSETLQIFHVDVFPPHLTLRREDEYGDDER
jgi:hypothetical protein